MFRFFFFFQDLNVYLQDKVYLAENQFTLADILMYYGIQPLIVSSSIWVFIIN